MLRATSSFFNKSLAGIVLLCAGYVTVVCKTTFVEHNIQSVFRDYVATKKGQITGIDYRPTDIISLTWWQKNSMSAGEMEVCFSDFSCTIPVVRNRTHTIAKVE